MAPAVPSRRSNIHLSTREFSPNPGQMKDPLKYYTGLLFSDPDTTSYDDIPWIRDTDEENAEMAEPPRHLPMNLRRRLHHLLPGIPTYGTKEHIYQRLR